MHGHNSTILTCWRYAYGWFPSMKSTSAGRPSGRWVKTLEGYRAFHPSPLPLKIVVTPKLVRALSRADRLLGSHAGEGRRRQNPHLRVRPFGRRKAVYSSRRKGTQATPGELLAADASVSPGERINHQLVDWREAFAWSGSKVPLPLIVLAVSNLVRTPRDTERRLDAAYNTVMRAIAARKAGGVLAKVWAGKRARVFCARAILAIREARARLVLEPPATKRRATRD